MKIRTLIAEKLLKQKCLCITIIFKCIFRYIPNLGSFLVHEVQKFKNIHKGWDHYFSKCPNTTDILPPFGSHKIYPSSSNVQLLLYHSLRNTLQLVLNYSLSRSTLLFTPYNSDLKWLRQLRKTQIQPNGSKHL